jgi:hypothetical protein
VDLARALKAGGSSLGRAKPVARLPCRAQVATSVLVLTFAWMMVRAHRVYNSDPGFETARVITRWLPLKTRSPETSGPFYCSWKLASGRSPA